MIDNEKNVAFWDQIAQQTNSSRKGFAGMLMEGREFEAIYRCKAEQERFLTFFNPLRSSRVLEIGSGGGRWGTFLSGLVGSYIGLDISPEMVAIAERERERKRLQNVRYECRSLLEFTDKQGFDLVYFSGVLQYMDDDVVKRCIAKATELLTQSGVIITRDSVQKTTRLEKGGDYPVIYRTETEYRSYFEQAGYKQTYSELSYRHKRFTKTASKLYRLPGVTYSMANIVRESLCLVDDLLGNPSFLKTDLHRRELEAGNPQEHRFSRYVRGF